MVTAALSTRAQYGFVTGIPCVSLSIGSTTAYISTRRPRPNQFSRIQTARRSQTRPAVQCAVNRNDENWERFQVKAKETIRTSRRFMQTNTGQAVLWGGLLWLLLTGRIGWIFDSFLFILFVFSVVPIIGVFVLRWWLNRQLEQGQCPSCGAPVTGLKGRAFQCMSCGQVVKTESGGDFSVNDPRSATIDIEAKRVE